MRESARNDISRTHANFARAHKCEQNTAFDIHTCYPHFIKCRHILQITHLIVNCNMVLSICHGVVVFNYYHNIIIIYKQKDKTNFDNILFVNTIYMTDFWCDDYYLV